MAHPFFTYDDTFMWRKAVGSGGATPDEWKRLQPALKEAFVVLEKRQRSGEQGFFDLPSERDQIALAEAAAKEVKKKFKRLIVIGIGGSDLGARALWQALGNPHKGVWLHFLNNPDPNVIARYAKSGAWWKETAIAVVSKSGTTLETLSIFLTLREALMKSVGKESHASHVYAITEPSGNPLHTLAEKEGYRVLPHPLNVGGRFSVLSVVGLFPAACAGVDVKRLLAGARAMQEAHQKEKERSAPARFAGLHLLGYTKRKQSIHVLMPYASFLGDIAFWYRQLWAESLGKRTKKGFVGPTPVAAFGAVDQHSQIQLYNEGPKDKILTFIEVDRFTTHLKVPRVEKGTKGLEQLSGQSFERILHAEREGTARALAKNGRPNGTIHLSAITPESVGALLMFYQIATAYMGELLGVDAYNQPGVEAGKKITKGLLDL